MKTQGPRKPGTRFPGTTKLTTIAIAAALLTGCLGSNSAPAGGGPAAGVTDNAAGTDNTAPRISGTPQRGVVTSDTYAFRPDASDDDGDPLAFSIRNKPSWTSFDTATGQLEGIPQFSDVGDYDGIEISVSDGIATASLAPFSIAVSQDALGSVTLEWLPPQVNTDGSTATDLAGYVIYWGTKPGSYDQKVTIGNVGLTAYVVDGLRPATYYFTATAFNTAGIQSDYSNEVERSVVIN